MQTFEEFSTTKKVNSLKGNILSTIWANIWGRNLSYASITSVDTCSNTITIDCLYINPSNTVEVEVRQYYRLTTGKLIRSNKPVYTDLLSKKIEL